jgi:hypothetical protein
MTNTLAFYDKQFIMAENFYNTDPGVNLLKPFFYVTASATNKARVFEPGKFFHADLIFASKAPFASRLILFVTETATK